MARPLRIEFPDSFYHITARGNNKQKIFLSNGDRYFFLKQLENLYQRVSIIIHAYCLMPNHYHLEITPPPKTLSRSIQWLNQIYATYFNQKYKRVGHLFQGRFKSILIETETHLTRLTKYIHLNPVKKDIVTDPTKYTWSSCQAYLGLIAKPSWLDITTTLNNFGNSLEKQRIEYKKFLTDIDTDNPMVNIKFSSILGSEKYIEQVRKKLNDLPDNYEISNLFTAKKKIQITEIINHVTAHYKIEKNEALKRDSKKNYIRDIIIYLSRKYTNDTYVKIGRYFHNIKPSALSIAYKRIENRINKDNKLKSEIEQIKSRLITNEN